MSQTPPCTFPPRLDSLDMLRGIAMAGMVLVNNPGSRNHVYPWLRHAGWTGCTIADLVFPFFLFAVGAAQAFSLASAAHTGRLPPDLFIRILRRTAVLFALGLFLNLLPGILDACLANTAVAMGQLRIMGVLQRIALVYFAACFCIIFLPVQALRVTIALVLLGYWAVLADFPGSLSPENNPVVSLDRLLLGPEHLLRGGTDPEGLLATMPALATALLGYTAGCFLRTERKSPSASLKLFAAGMIAVALGAVWGRLLPVCKDLWTGSYVLITAGWAAVVLALIRAALRLPGMRFMSAPLRIMGRNALVFFVGSGVTARILLAVNPGTGGTQAHLWSWLYETVFAAWLGRSAFSSLAFAAAWLIAWWGILYVLDRRGWHITA